MQTVKPPTPTTERPRRLRVAAAIAGFAVVATVIGVSALMRTSEGPVGTDAPFQPSDSAATVETLPSVTPAAPPAPFDNSKWIAYQGRTEGKPYRAFLIHPDGSGRIEIPTPEGASVRLPDWSPDGQKIVVTSSGPVPEFLYVYDLATNSIEVLFDCDEPCVGHDDPSYSADGSSIVFVGASGPFVNDVPSECGLWVGNVTTLETTRVTENPGCDREYYPRFSPDGTQIVYFRWRDEGPERNAVFVIDSTGGGERQLTAWDLVAGYPDWSPDGQWIVFTTYPDWDDVGISNLYRMRPDGTEVEQLTFYEGSTFRASVPRYTPDGKWILFTGVKATGRDMMAIPADGGEPITILTGGVYTYSTLQP